MLRDVRCNKELEVWAQYIKTGRKGKKELTNGPTLVLCQLTFDASFTSMNEC